VLLICYERKFVHIGMIFYKNISINLGDTPSEMLSDFHCKFELGWVIPNAYYMHRKKKYRGDLI